MRYANGVQFMDRAIGATSANPEDGTATWGLLWQWGRPTPFFGGYAENEWETSNALNEARTWTVVNRRIRIYSEKEGQTYYIDNYWLDDNRFEGTISDSYGNSKNFVMTKTYSRNWNSYYWNGYYGSGYYNGYYAPSTNSAKGVKASPEKPVTSIKAD